MWSADAQHGSDEEDDDEDSEDDSEEDSDDEAKKGGAAAAEQSREDRKAQKKARKEAAIARQKDKDVQVGDMPSSEEDEDESDEDMPANPNHSRAARKQTAQPKEVEEVTEGVAKMNAPGNRKEREAMEAAAAKERHMRLQAEGKTDQAKADLARLREIRERRAAEAARREVRTFFFFTIAAT
jgi:hypothetical protein